MSDRLLLSLAAFGLLPIALSYGAAPSVSMPYLLGIPVDSLALTHVMRAVMGLYLANAMFWIAGALLPALRTAALWNLFLFMAGLAAGRVLSLFADGVPGFVLLFYLAAEIAFAALAAAALRRESSPAAKAA